MKGFWNHTFSTLRTLLAARIPSTNLQSRHGYKKNTSLSSGSFIGIYIGFVILVSLVPYAGVEAELKENTIQQARILHEYSGKDIAGHYLAIVADSKGISQVSSAVNPIPIATFTQASAMVKSIDGVMVSDEAEHRIYVFSTDGMLGAEVGGKGSGTESLQSPTDLASKNGLKIFVADKENGRVKILDHELHYLSSLDISRAGTEYRMGLDRLSSAISWKPEKLCLLSSGYLQVWDSLGKGIHRFNSKGDYLGFSALTQAIGEITDMQCRADYIELYSAQSDKTAHMSGNGLWLGSYDITRDRAYQSNISSTNYADKWDELEQNYGHWVDSITEGNRLWILFESALFSFDIIE